ncbi:hypothetical protein QJQ45_008922 [Haematococcus lacustris]|nr:hypothetical protein QJQ45_008922 [Haematococcus lacustris]
MPLVYCARAAIGSSCGAHRSPARSAARGLLANGYSSSARGWAEAYTRAGGDWPRLREQVELVLPPHLPQRWDLGSKEGRPLALAYGEAGFSGSGTTGGKGVLVKQMQRQACKQFPGRVVLVHEFRTSRVSSARTNVVAG